MKLKILGAGLTAGLLAMGGMSACLAEGTSAASSTQAAPGTAQIGDIEISGGFARAMPPGAPTGSAYLTVTNRGKSEDVLTGVSSPAGMVELHQMSKSNGMMTMAPVEGGLAIPAGGTVQLQPGGYHLMFMKVGAPFAEGATVPVTLTFKTAGDVTLDLPVAPIGATAPMQGM